MHHVHVHVCSVFTRCVLSCGMHWAGCVPASGRSSLSSAAASAATAARVALGGGGSR